MKTEVAAIAFIKQFFYFSVKEFMLYVKISCTFQPRFYGSFMPCWLNFIFNILFNGSPAIKTNFSNGI